ncbi:Protein flp [Penicillium malachiteum]|uniref:Protein flp n=1 Tax=Penicillium malachiteum TaxID=1324776 RepID=UPI002547E217|nr:Protein flp [Penicillium malachiteum]KAJ5730158.1 Protein flp [Penicillium malachiteum]
MWKILSSLLVAQSVIIPHGNESSSVISRLQNLKPTLDHIRQISGTAGTSIGVVHHGQIIHKDNLGYRDVAAEIVPDSQTLYGLGSLTKSLTAIGIANMVHEGLLSWDTPVKDVLQDFAHKDPCVAKLTTVVDLLAHRTGLAGDISLTFQGDGKALLPADQLLPTFNQNDRVVPFRSEWVYNSWGYSIAGLIIEKLSGESLGSYLQKHVYNAFAMGNTTTQFSSLHSNNVAEPYATDSNATPVHLPSAMIFENSLFEAAAGAYSTVDDMLNYSTALLEAYKNVHTSDKLQNLFSSHIPVLGPSFRERAYAMGWIRTQLPGALGIMGENFDIIGEAEQLPELGRGSPSMLCLYHQGSTAGYYSNIALFPETQSAIVVLANSISLTDLPDTISQSIAQVLFDFVEPIDFVAFTKKTSAKLISQYEQQAALIATQRRSGTRDLPLESFAGRYWNSLKNFVLEIRVGAKNDALELLFQSYESQLYHLRHLYEHTFEWSLSLDEEAKRGRYHITDADYFLIHFSSHQKLVSGLVWANYSFEKSA